MQFSMHHPPPNNRLLQDSEEADSETERGGREGAYATLEDKGEAKASAKRAWLMLSVHRT
ncbi:hypothetical protein ZHAS_00012686 [Anopheles sinensis]|uniref:Uncharacterized protein n=1 Tax=Anopheles sinensis TaxID=74873 RepID=A0A084W3H5_ANOSI|nr:hypothetical protein ZHAS_00012686 [Anopheles sinensis]